VFCVVTFSVTEPGYCSQQSWPP